MQFYRTCKNLHFPKFFKVFENRLHYQLVTEYGNLGMVTSKVMRKRIV